MANINISELDEFDPENFSPKLEKIYKKNEQYKIAVESILADIQETSDINEEDIKNFTKSNNISNELLSKNSFIIWLAIERIKKCINNPLPVNYDSFKDSIFQLSEIWVDTKKYEWMLNNLFKKSINNTIIKDPEVNYADKKTHNKLIEEYLEKNKPSAKTFLRELKSNNVERYRKLKEKYKSYIVFLQKINLENKDMSFEEYIEEKLNPMFFSYNQSKMWIKNNNWYLKLTQNPTHINKWLDTEWNILEYTSIWNMIPFHLDTNFIWYWIWYRYEEVTSNLK